MIKFIEIAAKGRIVVDLLETRIAELSLINGKWCFSWFNNKELLTGSELRQIVDKLDELNGAG